MRVVEFVEASEADDPFWLFCRASTSGDSPGFRPADKSTFTSKKKKKTKTATEQAQRRTKIVSEYDQEIPQSQTADNPMAPQGRAAQPSRDTRKTN